MIDPQAVTNYNRSQNELEEYLLFCIAVAGKTAARQARLLEDFLLMERDPSPFESIRQMIAKGKLNSNLRESKIGQYGKIERAFTEVATRSLDLCTCTVAQLEAVHGIGPKTSRFFVVHSRPNQKYAILDTHILRWLRDHLSIETPRSTPSSTTMYAKLERQFIAHCLSVGRSVADVDLEIWRSYARPATAAIAS